MTFQSVPDTAVAEIIMATSGTTNWGPTQNNMAFEFGAGYDTSDLQNLSDELSTFWASEIMPLLSADVKLTEVHVRGLANDPDVEAFATASIPTTGGIGSNVLPASVAACLRLTSGFIGRSTRGRLYLAGLSDADVNDDDIAGATRALLVNAFANLLPGYLTAGKTWVIVSRFHDNAQRAFGLTYPITGVSFSSPQVATQKRRLHRY